MSDFQMEQFSPGTYVGSRPLRVNKRTGTVQIATERGLVVNSLLRRDEWQRLDTRIQQSALIRLNGVQDLRSRGLVTPISSLGVLTTQWSQASEMTPASVSMTGKAMSGQRDRVENKIVGRPIPIVFKDFEVPKRELEASRLMGNPIDTSNATMASRVVAEKAEDMLFNGDSGVIFGGDTIYGYTTEPNRKTGTASGLGGGDWGTLSNVVPTVAGAIGLLNNPTNRYFGPYVLYVATTQYNQANTTFFNDGTSDNGISRIKKIEGITDVKPSDTLADGSMILAQMTEDVIEWAEHLMITIVEWMSGDGMTGFFRVLMVGTPKAKSDYGSRSGIAHVTGL